MPYQELTTFQCQLGYAPDPSLPKNASELYEFFQDNITGIEQFQSSQDIIDNLPVPILKMRRVEDNFDQIDDRMDELVITTAKQHNPFISEEALTSNPLDALMVLFMNVDAYILRGTVLRYNENAEV
jgi:hypothetical protein